MKKLWWLLIPMAFWLWASWYGTRPVHAEGTKAYTVTQISNDPDTPIYKVTPSDAYVVRKTYNGTGGPVYEVWGSSDVVGPFTAEEMAKDVAYGLNSAHRQRLDEEEYRTNTNEK
jgi:hypothetical protein